MKELTIQVSYRRITYNKDMLLLLFPAPIVESLEGTNTYVYGAIDEKKKSLVGACILSISDKISKAAILHYCAVSDKFARSGIGSALLDTAAKNLRSIGVMYMIYREINDNPAPLINSFRFATHNEFLPGAVQEKLLYYNTSDISSNSSFIGKKGALKNIVKIENPRDDRVQKFNDNQENSFYKIKRKDYAPQFSGFYVEDNNIMGACKALIDENKVIINDVFISPSLLDITAYEMLLANSIITAAEDANIEEVCIQAVGDERIIEVKRLLGEPEKEVPALELIRYLK